MGCKSAKKFDNLYGDGILPLGKPLDNLIWELLEYIQSNLYQIIWQTLRDFWLSNIRMKYLCKNWFEMHGRKLIQILDVELVLLPVAHPWTPEILLLRASKPAFDGATAEKIVVFVLIGCQDEFCIF